MNLHLKLKVLKPQSGICKPSCKCSFAFMALCGSQLITVKADTKIAGDYILSLYTLKTKAVPLESILKAQ